jgi:hypothetical protein
VATRSSVGPVRCIVTASDAERYSERSDEEQRDLQNRMAGIEDQAARNAGLDRRRAHVLGSGDGSLTAWPQGTNELDLIVDYLRELSNELERVNRSLSAASRIRLRLSVSAGLVEVAAQGITGQAAIRATVLADSDQLRRALRKARKHSLAVIIDDKLFEDVVKTRRRGLRPGEYRRVVVLDKRGAEYVGWITIPGSGHPPGSAEDAGQASNGQQSTQRTGRKRIATSVKAAVIGAVGVIVAAGITAAATLSSLTSPPPATDSGSSGAPADPTVSPGAGSAHHPAGKLYTEVTDNHLGTDVFRDPMGDAVITGPVSIPFGTQVKVRCWAQNESTMGSINAFYLVETQPWAGEYAPANTFLNADTTGSLDPKVPECSAA